MTQTSPYGGRRDFDVLQADAGQDVDPYILRDFVINNVLHAADQTAARVLVNDMAADDTYIVDNVDQFTIGYASVDYEYRGVVAYGPFQIQTRIVDGAIVGYRLRAALYAADGTGADGVTFAVCVVPVTGHDSWGYERATLTGFLDGTNAVVFSQTTSAIPAWLSPLSGVCTVTFEAMSHVSRSVSDVPGSTAPVSLETLEVMLLVMAVGPGTPRLYGAHIAEVL